MIPSFAEAHYELARVWGMQGVAFQEESLKEYLLASNAAATAEFGYNSAAVRGFRVALSVPSI